MNAQEKNKAHKDTGRARLEMGNCVCFLLLLLFYIECVSEVLTHTEIFKQKKEESKETSQQDTCEEVFEGRGMVSVKIPKPQEVSVSGEVQRTPWLYPEES